MLNNREIATLFAFLIVAVFVFRFPSVRASLCTVVRAFFHPKLCVFHVAMLCYIGFLIAALWSVNYWTSALVKETVFWTLGSAFPILLVVHGSEEAKAKPWRWIMAESISTAVFVEFLLGEYVYPLAIELVLVPIAMFVITLRAFGRFHERKDELLPVLDIVLGILGLILAARIVVGLISDWPMLFTIDAMRRLTILPVLSVLYTPFVVAFLLLTEYEQAFLRIGLGSKASEQIVWYAKWRLAATFRLNVQGLRAFSRNHRLALLQVASREDVDALFATSGNR